MSTIRHGAQAQARNFIAKYGRERFRDLLDRFARGVSGQVTAEDFGVSRERVRQWKNAFGAVVVVYQVDPGCERLARGLRP